MMDTTSVLSTSDDFESKLADLLDYNPKDVANALSDFPISSELDADIDRFLNPSLLIKQEPLPGSPSAGGFSSDSASSSDSPYSSSPDASPHHHSAYPSSPDVSLMQFGMAAGYEPTTKFIAPQQTILPFDSMMLDGIPESVPTFSIGAAPIKTMMENKKPIQARNNNNNNTRKRTRDTMKAADTKPQEDEDQQTKRQRRLIKNRESAAKSRQRKKEYVDQLEQKVNVLQEENDQLKSENQNLREDVGYLSNIIRNTPGISPEVLKGIARRASHSTNSAKAAGVCLLIVLFTFGLFFNSNGLGSAATGAQAFGGRPALPFEMKAREVVPEVVPVHYGPGTSMEWSSETATKYSSISEREWMSTVGGETGGTSASKKSGGESFDAGFQERTLAWGKAPAGESNGGSHTRVFTSG